mmetsp:Transcript_9665/g.11270  ORF Transcript_9665/g.11270 Transcript_9665/m.11270 type:complete len:414 (+) Transcript_9665:166-1407(+)
MSANRYHVLLFLIICIGASSYISLVNDFVLKSEVDHASSIDIKKSNQQEESLSYHDHPNSNSNPQIVILGGPHKTGTSSLQSNLWKWTTHSTNIGVSAEDETDVILDNWVWPVPLSIATAEHNDTYTWDWDPSKAFYPMMEALRGPNYKIPDRLLFKLYSYEEIIDAFHKTMETYWQKGYNLIFGTEAVDLIVKLQEGPKMVRAISNRIIPLNVTSDQITVVVTYRTPKIDHMISQWHQLCKGKDTRPFYDWITTTKNTLGPLDALGMADMFLRLTDWNVALVDLEWLKANDWDLSNYVACHILKAECNEKSKQLVKLGVKEPMLRNVRNNERKPNISDRALAEMNSTLLAFDCNYMDLLVNRQDKFILYHELGVEKMIKNCRSINLDNIPKTRAQMKNRIVKIAEKYGAIEL